MPRDPSPSILKDIVPVFLAGGEGRRLRPLSTQKAPKPFIKAFGKPSMLQQSLQRAADMSAPLLICNHAHRELAEAQIAETGVRPRRILLEPVMRNTGPALAAAAHFLSHGGNPLMLVMPTDHAIKNPAALLAAVENAAPFAEQGKVVLFGAQPDRPETRYGYIGAGVQLGDGLYSVAAFHEKPEKTAAKEYIGKGHLWNTGIFLCNVHTLRDLYQALCPDIYDHAYAAVAKAGALQSSVFLQEEAFAACPNISVDYAVMEKAENLLVSPVSMEWNDLGTWSAFLAGLLR